MFWNKKKIITPEEIKEDVGIGPGGFGTLYGDGMVPFPYSQFNAWGTAFLPLLFGQDPWSWKSSILRTLQDHWRVRQFSRMLVESNPYAAALVRGMTSFICGRAGFNVEVMSKKTNKNKKLVQELQDKLNLFIEANNMDEAYAEKVYRDFRDGENFIQLFEPEEEEGECVIRWVEPDMIAIPNGESTEGVWSMGLKHKGFDYDTIEAICVQYFDATKVVYDFNDFFHSKQNATRNQKRGYSDFLPVLETLQNVYRLNYTWEQSQAVRESIAYIIEASATQSQVQQLNSSKTDGAVYDWRYKTGGESTIPVQKVSPGAEVTIPKGYLYKEGPKGSEVSLAVIKQSLNQVCSRFNAPTWLLTGESDSSYSSAALPESLFIRTIETRQYKEAKFWKRLYKRVLQYSMQDDLDDIDIRLIPPSPVTKNRCEEIKCDLDIVRGKLMSQHTFCSKYDLDFEEEQNKIATEPDMPDFNMKTGEEEKLPKTSSGNYQKEQKPEKP